MTTSREVLIASWRDEAQRATTEEWGWGALLADERVKSPALSWNYEALVTDGLRSASSYLDLHTAGGEQLLRVRDAWPARVVVTESYPPSLELARKRLEPMGVVVHPSPGMSLYETLAFPAASFDVITIKHAPFSAQEMERVLRPGGVVVTQQVDGTSDSDLIEAITGGETKWPYINLAFYSSALATVGLDIELALESEGKKVFRDVGAVVYYLTKNSYLLDDFSIDAFLPQLMALQERLEATGQLAFFDKHFLIKAKKRR